MSASNWRICPQCKIVCQDKRRAALQCAAKSYGKVSREEYARLSRKADAMPAQPTEETLREDYHQGISDDGLYSVGYHGRCDECGLTFSFEHEVKVPLGGEEPA